VSSYLAISPLPARGWRFVFCGTIRHRVNGAPALPGDLPYGARTFLDGDEAPSRLSDRHLPRVPTSIAEIRADDTLTAGLNVVVSRFARPFGPPLL
jgi:hypothetical protein